MDNAQLAELLMGIARAQNAVIEAIERAQPGFRNNHAVPVLTVAANVRAATPRVQDLPSRILLRMQGRTPFDIAQIQQDFEAAVASAGSAIPVDPGSKIPPAAARVAARRAAAKGNTARPAAAPPPPEPPEPESDDLDFSKKR